MTAPADGRAGRDARDEPGVQHRHALGEPREGQVTCSISDSRRDHRRRDRDAAEQHQPAHQPDRVDEVQRRHRRRPCPSAPHRTRTAARASTRPCRSPRRRAGCRAPRPPAVRRRADFAPCSSANATVVTSAAPNSDAERHADDADGGERCARAAGCADPPTGRGGCAGGSVAALGGEGQAAEQAGDDRGADAGGRADEGGEQRHQDRTDDEHGLVYAPPRARTRSAPRAAGRGRGTSGCARTRRSAAARRRRAAAAT